MVRVQTGTWSEVRPSEKKRGENREQSETSIPGLPLGARLSGEIPALSKISSDSNVQFLPRVP